MKTAICLIAKNEAETLCEWVVYHHLLGFDAFVVLDNASTDGTAAVIARLSARFHIVHVPWPSTKPTYQLDAYEHALRLVRDEYDWVAFLDADEYLVLLDDPDVKTFLSRFGDRNAVAFNWAIYGSSGHVAKPAGLTIENFVMRAPDDFGPNQHVKAIVRPKSAASCANPHYFRMFSAYANVLGADVVWQSTGVAAPPVILSVARVNHYFVRSREHWAEKLRRGYHDTVRAQSDFEAYDRNEIRDESALRIAGAVKETMRRYGLADLGGVAP
jgi:glycosyltransferase involved in cell wall biosynthesis